MWMRPNDILWAPPISDPQLWAHVKQAKHKNLPWLFDRKIFREGGCSALQGLLNDA